MLAGLVDAIVILIALGANLPGRHESPADALSSALAAMPARGIKVERASAWHVFAADPPGVQPDFANGAAIVSATLGLEDLMATLRRLEEDFGRERREPWAPRTLDLDLLAFGGFVSAGFAAAADLGNQPAATSEVIVPHPRLHLRPYVLLPLKEIAPQWRHPVFGLTPGEMLAKLAKP